MSLINDALKKAQKIQPRAHAANLRLPEESGPPAMPVQCTGTPANTDPASSSGPRRAPRPGVILAAAGIVFTGAFFLVVFAGFLIWRHAAPEGPELAAATGQLPASGTTVTALQTTDGASQEAPSIAHAGRSAAAPTPAPMSGPETPAGAASSHPPALEPGGTSQILDSEAPGTAIASAEAPAPAPAPDPRIQTFVLGLKVTGVRTGEKPKVLMNDRVYAIGESVSSDFDLHLTQIAMRSLELTDGVGNVYEVRF